MGVNIPGLSATDIDEANQKILQNNTVYQRLERARSRRVPPPPAPDSVPNHRPVPSHPTLKPAFRVTDKPQLPLTQPRPPPIPARTPPISKLRKPSGEQPPPPASPRAAHQIRPLHLPSQSARQQPASPRLPRQPPPPSTSKPSFLRKLSKSPGGGAAVPSSPASLGGGGPPPPPPPPPPAEGVFTPASAGPGPLPTLVKQPAAPASTKPNSSSEQEGGNQALLQAIR